MLNSLLMNIWVGTFLSVSVVSVVSLIGIFFISMKKERLQKIQLILVAFATGGLLGGAFFHLLPETYESFEDPRLASIWMITGFILFFTLERFLHWHHDHNPGIFDKDIKPMGILNLVADFIHNFLDGLLIGAAFLYSPEIGFATAVIVLMHELPQEIGDFGILIHSGFSTRKALKFNFLSACSAFIGALVVLLFSHISGILSKWILPFAAGSFIYLAAADLIPELHREKTLKRSVYQFTALLLGIGLLYLISSLGHMH